MERCDKHDDCMKELRVDIKDSSIHTSKLEGTVNGFIIATQEYINASRKDIYGNGGMLSKIQSVSNQITLQWGLICVVIIALLALLKK